MQPGPTVPASGVAFFGPLQVRAGRRSACPGRTMPAPGSSAARPPGPCPPSLGLLCPPRAGLDRHGPTVPRWSWSRAPSGVALGRGLGRPARSPRRFSPRSGPPIFPRFLPLGSARISPVTRGFGVFPGFITRTAAISPRNARSINLQRIKSTINRANCFQILFAFLRFNLDICENFSKSTNKTRIPTIHPPPSINDQSTKNAPSLISK